MHYSPSHNGLFAGTKGHLVKAGRMGQAFCSVLLWEPALSPYIPRATLFVLVCDTQQLKIDKLPTVFVESSGRRVGT